MKSYLIYIVVLLSFNLHDGHCQSQDSTVRFFSFKGFVKDASDSVSLGGGNFTYTKLPYYDDIGRVSIGKDGRFSDQLLQQTSYLIEVSREMYEPYSKEVTLTSDTTLNIYLTNKFSKIKRLDNLIFSQGSNKIHEQSYTELDSLAQWLKQYPTINIQLEGHTDFAGNPAANYELSAARVSAVLDYLVQKGIRNKRIKTKAFGGTMPLSTQRSSEAKMKNRRVEVRILNIK